MDDDEKQFRRINILIRESQYQHCQRLGLNLSGLVRDQLDDRFSDRKVVLSVSAKTRALYNKAISNFGATDEELEKYLLVALDMLLEEKSEDIDRIRKGIKEGGRK